MSFSVFTKLCNHCHYLIPEYLHHPERNLVAFRSHSPSSSPSTPGNHKSTFLPMGLPILDTHIDKIMQRGAFCVWLFHVMLSRLTCGALCICTLLHLMAEEYFVICIHHKLLIDPSVYGQRNMTFGDYYEWCCYEHLCTGFCVGVCFQFPWVYNEFLLSQRELYAYLFVELPNSFSKLTAPFQTPTSNGWKLQFLHILAKTFYHVSDNSHPRGCEMVSRCGSDFRFPKD